ncbi:MAG: branched-chain amino acid ABC transporter permease [Pyrobaculum sp.]|uniref:Amino acid/amide ABC transporter membrane protein 2, HAAT family n=2 Tax=Pyrobaculum arsenaticum TaxID=121277 RepID=A4WKZ4_PYRAR|nr:branched-chain amino acid ABC transporter permease [Pyrobaculum arsenaticum]ABP51061.1 amino acid/amide ABC transporter membrane protein 2, HAAT family [Pyrobaculum arsenaticum DSM 13514]MCY0891703.1 branched-chain amino acid ABC transporter permease [Pyrobaculum arsenaticum]NYR15213.1 branched-chain amino acid ABC transporter permease [Pyrobaculum arsenaticum]
MRQFVGLIIYALSVAAVAAAGRDVQSYLLTTIVDVAIYLIITLSLNLEAGIGGIPNFGRVLTVAFGAYMAGGVIGRIALWAKGMSYDYIYDNAAAVSALSKSMTAVDAAAMLALGVAISIAVGASLGLIASLPARRLSADYLAITLLAFGDVAYYIGLNYEPLVGGTLGVSAPPIYEKLFGGGTMRLIGAVAVSAGAALLVYLLIQRLSQSPFGRILRIHREDPELVSVLGRDPAYIRAWTMAIGGAVSAVAGLLYALYAGAVHPRGFERINFTFYPWLIMILGGMGNNLGVVNGVFIFVVIYRILDIFKYEIGNAVGFDPVWLGYMLFGGLAMLVIALAPRGLVPEKAEPVVGGRRVTPPPQGQTQSRRE